MLDVFKADGFSTLELTAAVNKQDFLPQFLLPHFEAMPVNKTTIAVEEMGGTLALVQSSPRGAPGKAVADDKRTVRDLRTVQLRMSDRIYADEVQDIRAFGSQSELEQLQARVNRRLMKLRRNIELTQENLRLGAVKGTILDADGSTTIYNLFTEFGVTQITEVDFDLDNASPASGAVRTVCNAQVRAIKRELQGLTPPNLQIIGICGDTFWDELTAHSEVRTTYLNYAAAADLREGNAFGTFRYGGITWVNYQGTDDNSTVAVAATKCHLFPANVPGLFQVAHAPATYAETVNTPGLPFYSKMAPDLNLNEFVDLDVQSHCLPICTVPRVLIQGKNT